MFAWDGTVKLGDLITFAGFVIAASSLLVSTRASILEVKTSVSSSTSST